MARSLIISTKENAAKVVLDGNEIDDVISYSLAENSEGVKLTVQVLITGPVEVQM